MKKLLTLLLLLCTAVVQAQSLQWGDKYKFRDAFYFGPAGDRYVLNGNLYRMEYKYSMNLFHPLRTVEMHPFGKDLRFGDVLELPTDVSENAGIQLPIMFVETQKEVLYMGTTAPRKGEPATLYQARLNAENLAVNSKLEPLIQIQPEGNKRAYVAFATQSSPDKSKYYVLANNASFWKGWTSATVYVYDQNHKLLWQKDIDVDSEKDGYYPMDVDMDNDGNVYILCVGDKPSEDNHRNFLGLRYEPQQSHVICLFDQGKTRKDMDIKIGDLYLNSVRMDFSNKQDIICAGFYSQKKNEEIDGCFYMRIDKATQAPTKISMKEFEVDFIKQNMRKLEEARTEAQAARGKEIQMLNCDFQDLIIREDGGAYLIAEKNYTYYHQYTGANGTINTSEHFYLDIIVVSINPEGDIDWQVKVPKVQHTHNDGGMYSSYAMMVQPDGLHFYYNSTLVNSDPNAPNRFRALKLKGKEALIMEAVVDATGNVAQKPFVYTKALKYKPMPYWFIPLNDKEMAALGNVNKKNNVYGVMRVR